MKTRKGFVSNSSSSSFVIGFKNDEENLTEERLLPLFKVESGSIFYPFAKEMCRLIVELSEVYNPRKDWDEDFNAENLKKEGYKKVYVGCSSTGEGGLEGVLCEMELNYKDDHFAFIKEGR